MADLEKFKVSQSNDLIEASYNLTLNEKRLILCAASMIDSRKAHPEGEDGILVVHAEDFAKLFGLETKHAYGILAEAVDRLWPREIKSTEIGDMRWIYYRKYVEGRGCVRLGFSPSVLPQMTMLNREFTSYQLKHIGNLSTFYSIRVYELAAQTVNLRNGRRYIDLARLREMLDLGDKYANVRDLKKWVIDKAIEDINAHTNLRVKVIPRKEGRSIIGYDFVVVRDDQMALAM